MRVPFFDLELSTQQVRDEFLESVNQVLDSGYFCLGPIVEKFEQDFARYCGATDCVGVNSGTSALHLALAALGVGPGDEVITVPTTFVATAWAISYVGAKPVFVDVDPDTWTLDPNKLEEAITPRTKAIIPVHLYGCPAEMISILEIADRHSIPVIEDAAQAHGAMYFDRPVGAIGRIGCFSFYPSKNLGAFGEGGAVVTDDPKIADRVRALRNHAQFDQKNRHDEIGFNYRMDALQACALGPKLTQLNDCNERRRQHARVYHEMLEHVPGVQLQQISSGLSSVYHLFVVLVNQRDQVAESLNQAGVATGVHYPIPVHRQPAYSHLASEALPIAEGLASRCLSLPMYPDLTLEQTQYAADQLRRIVSEQSTAAPLTVVNGLPASPEGSPT